jgi:hypothetical protein
MTTKPPSGLAAPGASADETIDDSLDEILLEANERSLENPVRNPSVPRLQIPQFGSTGSAASTGPLDGPATPLPLPGIAPPPEDGLGGGGGVMMSSEVASALADGIEDPDADPDANVVTASSDAGPEGPPLDEDMAPTPAPALASSDEVTQIVRPSVLDSHGEESTKVEPPETTAQLAAATKALGDDGLALTDQASAEREKALRRLTPPPAAPAHAADSEFEDPEDEALAGMPLGHDTPSDIRIEDDEDESTANGRGPMAAASRPEPLPFGGRLPPPPGLPIGQPFGHVRLPTPSPGFVPPVLPTPNQTFSPVAASSPFGNARGTMPAIAIPAPSGIPTAGAGRSFIDRKVSVPVVALAAFVVAMFGVGLIVGFTMRGSDTQVVVAPAPAAAARAVAAVPPPAPAPTPAVEAVPPAPPSMPTAAVHEPPAQAQAKEPPAAIKEPPPPPPEPEAAIAEPPPVHRAPPPPATGPRPIRRVASAPIQAKQVKPKKKDVDSRGVSKGWVDPFSQ